MHNEVLCLVFQLYRGGPHHCFIILMSGSLYYVPRVQIIVVYEKWTHDSKLAYGWIVQVVCEAYVKQILDYMRVSTVGDSPLPI